MKENKILIINQGHTRNYGDIAINETISTFFKSNNYEIEFVPFWSEKLIFRKKSSKSLKIFLKITMNIPLLLDIYNKKFIRKQIKNKKYKFVIIGGGELLCGHKGFNSSLYIWTKILKEKNIPIYLIGVSGDLDMTTKLIKRNKKSLERCSLIFARDSYTYNILKTNYGVAAQRWPDVVFGYNEICKPQIDKKEKRDCVICVPIAYSNQIKKTLKLNNLDEYYKYLIREIETVVCCNDKIIITSSVYTDNEETKKFYNYAKKKLLQYNVQFKSYSTLNSYINLVNNAHTIISGRMHALILGSIYECKTKVIPFKKKLEVFQQEYKTQKDIDNAKNNVLKELNEILKIK